MATVVNFHNKDYKNLLNGLKRSLSWQYLREKSEYKTSFSEQGFLTLVVDNVDILATDLNLNGDLASSFAIIYGIFFCRYGKAGLNAVMEYVKERNLELTARQLAVKHSYYNSWESGIHMPDEVKENIEQLFSENAINSEIPEISLAVICYKHIEKIKSYATESFSKFSDMESETFKMLKSACISAGKPVWVDEFDEIIAPPIETKLSASDKERFYNSIDQTVKTANSVEDAIVEFIMDGYLY